MAHVAGSTTDWRNPRDQRTHQLSRPACPAPAYRERRADYVALVCDVMLPSLAGEGLIDAVDVFCGTIAFSRAETQQLFDHAQRLGLPVKLHAAQLSDQDGAGRVAQYHGLSADYLEHLSEMGIRAMAAAGTVAVLLPGAYYFLRETQLPPIAKLRAHGVPIAPPPTATPAPRRCSRCDWRPIWPAPCFGSPRKRPCVA